MCGNFRGDQRAQYCRLTLLSPCPTAVAVLLPPPLAMGQWCFGVDGEDKEGAFPMPTLKCSRRHAF